MFEAELEGDATMVVDEDLEESRPLIECFLEAVRGRRADSCLLSLANG